MTDHEIYIGVIDAITSITSHNRWTITTENTLAEDLEFDSLDYVELVLELEHEFDCKFETSDIEACKTVGDVVALVSKQMKAEAA